MIINRKFTFVNMEAKDSSEIFHTVGKKLEKDHYVKNTYVDAVIKREAENPTGLQIDDKNGIAIPHANAEYVNKSIVSVIILKNPIEFHLMIDPEKIIKTRLVFLLAINDPDNQIIMLKKLMKIFQNKDLLSMLPTKTSSNEVFDTLKKYFA